jgi:hypothetical protein
LDWFCSRLVICSLVRVVWIDVDAMQCWTGLGENWSDELELMESRRFSSNGSKFKGSIEISLVYQGLAFKTF